MNNLLLICETSNFKTFTRRSTTEAIKRRYSNTYVLANVPVRKVFNKQLKSDFFSSIPCLISYQIPFINIDLIYGTENVKRFDQTDDVIVLSSPRQHFVLDKIKKKSNIAVILSDPYHLMGYGYEETKKILSASDIIFATSKSLASQYLPKYFPDINSKVIYWPNTVDTNIWDICKLQDNSGKKSSQVTVGFAGNIMEVTDLQLLDYITTECKEMTFEIAGKIKVDSKKNIARFHKIESKNNVEYIGYIDYEKLPEKVYEWDIGILIDKKNELSSYHHHNKLYQYLALGKPVVAYRNHNDYEYLEEVVFLADDFDEYVRVLRQAVEYTDNPDFIKKAVRYAKDNNADKRAEQFIKVLSNET